jgi:membrane associated rhomboid family serine protease
MTRHFYTSWLSVVDGRPHTLLTSVFSHADIVHLGLNLNSLFIAQSVVGLIGEWEFLLFYILSGLVSSLGQVMSAGLFPMGAKFATQCTPCLGASGAVCGVIGLIWAFFPKDRYTSLVGTWPMEKLALGFAAFDIGGFAYKLMYGPTAGLPIGHMAHFSGLCYGYVYANTYLRYRVPTAKAQLEHNARQKRIPAGSESSQ